MDVPHEVLPLLAHLFDGLTALGTSSRLAAAWMRKAGVHARDTLLDLGCGKGGPAIAVARACGCRVVGVDAHEPFVLAARSHARERGLAERCAFVQADVRTWRSERQMLPRAGMMLSLLPALDAIALLARHVRPGGFVLTDDAVRSPGVRADPALPMSLAQLREAIEARGHRVLRARSLAPADVSRLDARLHATLSRNAQALARRDPHARSLLREVLHRQRKAHSLLTGPIRPAYVLVQLAR